MTAVIEDVPMNVDHEANKPVDIEAELANLSAPQIRVRTHLVNNEREVLEAETRIIGFTVRDWEDKANENLRTVKLFNRMPYLVANISEMLELEMDQEEEGGNVDLDARRTQCAIIKTTMRSTAFLPMIGLVPAEQLKPGDLVGVNKDSHLILEKMPPDYDPRVRTMEVVERPTESYDDVGGCEKQIEELKEAVVLPMTHRHLFEKLGIRPPKGVLLYGPPGTGKTMLARAVAAQTNSTFLKLSATQLVQMFIGDGARLVRDAFDLAREKAPTIMFIDELDAIGSKRFNSTKSGDREAQRTLLELLSQLDGFQQNDDVKLIAATNRVDILDPALLRSGRIDKKIELPLPDKEAREKIMKIHSAKMKVSKDVNYEELSRCTEGFNGAQCKAVCVEAGMIALRRDAIELLHEDYMDGILEVRAKKKPNLAYYI